MCIQQSRCLFTSNVSREIRVQFYFLLLRRCWNFSNYFPLEKLRLPESVFANRRAYGLIKHYFFYFSIYYHPVFIVHNGKLPYSLLNCYTIYKIIKRILFYDYATSYNVVEIIRKSKPSKHFLQGRIYCGGIYFHLQKIENRQAIIFIDSVKKEIAYTVSIII